MFDVRCSMLDVERMEKRQNFKIGPKHFALRVLKLDRSFAEHASVARFANQLARSATSVGANYRAHAEHDHEQNLPRSWGSWRKKRTKACYWLELIRDGNFFRRRSIASLLAEADELTAIFTSGRRSAVTTSNIKLQTSNISP